MTRSPPERAGLCRARTSSRGDRRTTTLRERAITSLLTSRKNLDLMLTCQKGVGAQCLIPAVGSPVLRMGCFRR